MKTDAVKLAENVKDRVSDTVKETFNQFIDEPRRRAEAESMVKEAPQFAQWDQQVPSGGGPFGQMSESWHQSARPRVTLPQHRKISREDEQALLQWELERQRLEAERLAKLQDHEVGGDESELTGFLPASHISFNSQSTGDGVLNGRRPANQARSDLERKLLTEIEQLAEAPPTVKRERFTHTKLTLLVQSVQGSQVFQQFFSIGIVIM
ncbi:unnamed protein product [Haemonchus placei]|uniref:AKAP2_C domain-containing protein n=1 Tax=Haemonchus placei TaxID=6290 RepID=A0A0N4W984_HAEPC|nr:unnamed protein product [Haemonchus placei]